MRLIAALRSQPGFAVYRNTVVRVCVDALQANYPAVARLVGDPWFRAAATIYVRRAPPSQPCLVDYGEGFAGFLADFAPAAQLPYLPDVARLDRLWTEAHLAPDDAPLDAARVAALAPAELADTVLRPNAAARWAWFANHPAFSIWRHSRSADTGERRAVRCIRTRLAGRGRADCAQRGQGELERTESRCVRVARRLRRRTQARRVRRSRARGRPVCSDPSPLLRWPALLRAGAFGRLQRSFQPMESTT